MGFASNSKLCLYVGYQVSRVGQTGKVLLTLLSNGFHELLVVIRKGLVVVFEVRLGTSKKKFPQTVVGLINQ